MKRRAILSSSLLGFGSVITSTTAIAQETQKKTKKTETFDVVVIGCGAAGLAAAIETADRGGKVVVLEKLPSPMGNTVYAGGTFNAVNTWVQKRDGIEDSVDNLYRDMMNQSMQRGDKDLTRMFCENSANVVKWVTDRLNITWRPIDIQIAPNLGRVHEIDGGGSTGGSRLIKNMLEEAKKLGIDIRFNTKAIELLKDENLNCLGVRTTGKNGAKDFLAKGGVILCTGGFHNNKELVARYMGGDVAWMPLRGSPYITGENIILTQPFFPMYVNMDQFHAGPIHSGTRANPSNLVNYGICVDPQGNRFIDENSTYVFFGQNTPRRIKSNQAYIILDSVQANNPLVQGRFKRYIKANAPIFKANTIEELAKEANLPTENLLRTVNQYNDAVKAGNAKNLPIPNSQVKPLPVEKAPFYCLNFSGGMTTTFGGPKFNKKAEIVNTEGQSIPGLYGAGNAVGGIFYDNYIAGSQLCACVLWGRIAGAEALNRAKKSKS